MPGVLIPNLFDLTGEVNPVDYGAVGDGVHDDEAAILAAIAAAGPGGTVRLPRGNFVANHLPVTQNGVTLRGAGVGATTITKRVGSDTNTPLIFLDDVGHCLVADLTVDGRGTEQPWWLEDPYDADVYRVEENEGVSANNIEIRGGSGNSVVNVRTVNSGSAGLRVYGSPDTYVCRVHGANNGFGSIVFYRDGDYYTGDEATNSLVVDSGGEYDYCDPIRIITNYVTVDRCYGNYVRTIEGAPDQFAGLYFAMCVGCKVLNSTFRGNSNRGIDLNNAEGDTYNITIANCTIDGHARGGILLGTGNCAVIGNVVTNCGTDTSTGGPYGSLSAGILCRGSHHLIVGNIITPAGGTQNYGLRSIGLTFYLKVGINQLHGAGLHEIDPELEDDAGYEIAALAA